MTQYGSAQGFIGYHSDRGHDMSNPLLSDGDRINEALLVASEWIDNIYGTAFVGYKTAGFTQDREWPRTNAYVATPPQYYNFDTAEIPVRVTNATYEAAYREVITPGSLMVDFSPVKYRSVAIYQAITVDYAQFSSAADVQKQFTIIGALLAPLLTEQGVGASNLGGGAFRK